MSDLSIFILAIAAIWIAYILKDRTHVNIHYDLTPSNHDDPDDEGGEFSIDEEEELDTVALAAEDHRRAS